MQKQQIPSPWRRRIGTNVGHQARGVASWLLVLDARRGMHVVERISKYPPATMVSPQINMAILTSFLASISPSSTTLPPSFLALFPTLTDHFYLPLPAPEKNWANKDHASDNSTHPPPKSKLIETLWVRSCQIGLDQSFTSCKTLIKSYLTTPRPQGQLSVSFNASLPLLSLARRAEGH